MNLKNIINKWAIKVFAVLVIFTAFSCEDELIELNENPNAIVDLPYGMQFTQIQLHTTGSRYEIRRAAMGYTLSAIQQFSDLETNGTYAPGDKYLDDPTFAGSLFDRAYTNEYKDLADYMNRTNEDETAGNYYAMGQIWTAVSFHRLTDMYGDVPYFQSGRGYLDNNWFVEYDAQSAIYADMLQKLEQGASSLNASMKTMEGQDLLYASDIAQWKKMAYSYMLRLGLRLVKVDPAAAESWVKKAIAGGVMTSLDDSAVLTHQSTGGWISTNAFGEAFVNDKLFRLSGTLVDWLQDNNDPRLNIVGALPETGIHKGLPNGHDKATIQNDPSWSGSLNDYTQINLDLVQLDSPTLFLTYAEVELMLAEAAVRGWHNGDAETHYNNGVRAAMEQFSVYGVTTPSTAEVDAYLAAKPYNDANGMELIGEQYWMATFLNPWEGYSNWRRIEYPTLTPTNYAGNVTGGTIPRRLVYPVSEYSINGENVSAAVSRQGPDNYTTRIWWDQ